MFWKFKKYQLKVPAHIDYLGDLRAFVVKIRDDYDFSDKIINAFRLCVDEAATNIIQHSYKDTEGQITIRASIKKKHLTIFIIDQGLYFDLRKIQAPDLNYYIDIGKKGGLGVFIIRKLMDEIDYYKTREGNILKLTKYREIETKKKRLRLFFSTSNFS